MSYDTSDFTSKFFLDDCNKSGMQLNRSGVKSQNSIGFGEKYQSPLRPIYNKI